MARYTSKDGDTLDWICYQFYGSSQRYTEAVLTANPNLAKRGVIYDSGITITLPDFPELNIATGEIRLWS